MDVVGTVVSMVLVLMLVTPFLVFGGALVIAAVMTVLECLAAPVVALVEWASSKNSD